ncbi:hypothetical protein Bca52824_005106 [Brassica carinata]|uniref:Uncharacterized protein n=1 Tax=Brassica carinata TaxID=52824 RepID=A0A8X7WQ89_BRACI|nr:hypothetical protein Bca52824_005106 [Brassica carinata]
MEVRFSCENRRVWIEEKMNQTGDFGVPFGFSYLDGGGEFVDGIVWKGTKSQTGGVKITKSY